MSRISRRALLASASALLAGATLPLQAQAVPAIHVAKDPNCGCCQAWIDILKAEGFDVTVQMMGYDDLQAYKAHMGVPEALYSCHTAMVDGYVLEGHVPIADIRRLIAERPDAIGLTVPAMPIGSPGMGPETERESYDVILFRTKGAAEVYSHYPAA